MMGMRVLATLRVLLLVSLPLASSFSNIVKKDTVKLLFEIDESCHARIHLPPSPPVDNVPPPRKMFSKNSRTKPQSVLDYEEKVERMHLVKRAKPSISSTLDMVFLDDSVVVVNKPSGVLCVPDINKNPSLLDLVWNQYGNHDNTSDGSSGGAKKDNEDTENPSSMIVNRLDMDTSGLVVFGRTPSVTKVLNEALRDRQVWKEYEALVCGHISVVESGLIDLPLQRDSEHPPFMRVATPTSEAAAATLIDDLKQSGYKKQGRKKAKPSQTEFRVVERTYLGNSLPVTRIRLRPKTGRTHQLRVHCAAMGHPILGDPTYGIHGDAAMFGGLKDSILTPVAATDNLVLERTAFEVQEALAQAYPPNVEPMCLHAAMLRLRHPVTGKAVEWTAPVPF